jgi:DNA integrity scanning protein DisA with diadenylate cyclase activity
MGAANISELNDDVRFLLIALFRIASDIGSVHYSIGREAVKDLEEYTFDNFRALISMTNQSVSTFVSFFENCLNGIIAAFDFLRELFKIVGVRKVEDVILRKVDLLSVVNPSEIDVNLLKFQLKTS